MQGYLRRATLEDSRLLFEWANDPVVRKNSFSTKEITWEEHKIWFEKVLKNEDCMQYIYMHDKEPIGQVRIQIAGDEALIGYSICASVRGKGYGKKLLVVLSEQVKKDFPNVRKLIGKVKPENIASQKAFTHSGYKYRHGVYEWTI